MIHLGDDDLNPSQQISSSKATAVKSRWLRHGDKKKTRKCIFWLFQQRFWGNKMMSVTDLYISKYWEVHTSRSSFLRLVTVGDDVWLYKKLLYMIRNSINKQLIHLDLLSLHRIKLCHFYDSSQTRIQSIIRTIYHLLDSPLFHWVRTAVHQKGENVLP